MGMVLITDLTKDIAYFAKSKSDTADSTDKNVFELVGDTNDTITMGKVIGTPARFFSTKDKANLKTFGIGKKFKIAKQILNASIKDMSKLFRKGTFLYNFFEEKDIPSKVFNIKDRRGVSHSIPNEVVVEHIALTKGSERNKIEQILRQIDFKNGNVNHFLEHLAKAIAEQYEGVIGSGEKKASQSKEKTMRTRITRKAEKKNSLTAALETIERALFAEDNAVEDAKEIADNLESEIVEEAKELIEMEKEIVEESTGISVDSNQNERANNNWPIESRHAVAKKLLKMAKVLLENNK
jgi:hypothetical protein